MSNIPCINCITFAVCNAQVSDDRLYADVINNLIPKCSLIEEYIEYSSTQDSYWLTLQVATFLKSHNY